MFHRSIPAREHQQAADLQYFNINSRHPTHIVFPLLFATIFSDSRNLFLLAAFPGFQRSRPPATTYQVAEDSLQVSVGRRAPGAARTRQRHSHKRSRRKEPQVFQRYIYKYTGARPATPPWRRHPRHPIPAPRRQFHLRPPKHTKKNALCLYPCPGAQTVVAQ